ncbi:Actin-related protein 6 [Nymphaea thermarum]|nr:Actin-related protein 6 [Nymphaea thermarum]
MERSKHEKRGCLVQVWRPPCRRLHTPSSSLLPLTDKDYDNQLVRQPAGFKRRCARGLWRRCEDKVHRHLATSHSRSFRRDIFGFGLQPKRFFLKKFQSRTNIPIFPPQSRFFIRRSGFGVKTEKEGARAEGRKGTVKKKKKLSSLLFFIMSPPSSVVVLDNGGGLCKAGIGGDRDPIAVVPNCVGRSSTGSHHHHGSSKSKKWLVADQLQDSDDVMSIRRPLDRGYLINPDLQKEIWDRIFKALLKVDPSDSSLLLVEPLFNLPSIQRSTDELVFEDFGFQSLYVADSPSLVHLYETSRCPPDRVMATSQCSLVVDCGFSFTHAAPVFQNFTLNYAVKRLDLGGKALTNYLKELVSYRSINVMDETFIMDDVKEKLCCVSLNVPRDLQGLLHQLPPHAVTLAPSNASASDARVHPGEYSFSITVSRTTRDHSFYCEEEDQTVA